MIGGEVSRSSKRVASSDILAPFALFVCDVLHTMGVVSPTCTLALRLPRLPRPRDGAAGATGSGFIDELPLVFATVRSVAKWICSDTPIASIDCPSTRLTSDRDSTVAVKPEPLALSTGVAIFNFSSQSIERSLGVVQPLRKAGEAAASVDLPS